MTSLLQRALGQAWSAATARSESLLEGTRQWLLAGTAQLDPQCRIHRGARIEPLGRDPRSISVGAHTHVRGQLLVAAHGGRIAIGQWCYIGEGSHLWSAQEIVIEDRVLVSHGCEIHDWNAHPIDPQLRHQQYRHIVEHGHAPSSFGSTSAPIRIKEDAWIGFGATVLKGVTIGARSIVASRSVVTEDVPDDTIVAGSPAKVIRTL